MKRYESYKDSGIEWIGGIPSHWKSIRIKDTGFLYGGLTGKSGDDFRDENNPNNRPFIPFTNIFRNTYISSDNFGQVIINDGESQNRVQKNDIFFLMSSEDYEDLGKTSILIDDYDELYLNSFCKGLRITNSKVYPMFLNYQLSGYTHKKLISVEGSGFTRINLRQDKLTNTPVLLPPLLEQEQIVSFLDEKTSKIDVLIKKKEQKIELLREYRTSLINRVITKGLNTDVPMKDSGVEWIGEIPSHWITSNVRYELDFHDNKRIPLSSEEREGRQGEYRYYGSTGVIDYVDDYLFDGEYILIGEDGSNLRLRNYPLSSVVDGKFWVNNHSHILKTKSGVNKYYSHLLEMTDFTTFITGSTQPKLTMDNLKEVPLVSPPLPEQEQIVSYLEGKTGEIDSTIDSEKKKIDLLKEYRQSLISSVITGKIKVVD
jgi:type I restriction enzyme S subunit